MIVSEVEFSNIGFEKIKRVVGYARVSTGTDATLHSLASQISYFKSYINKQAGWHLENIYSDEALTGTKDTRASFQQMIKDAKEQKFDMIMTKSVSRFARNTTTLLSVVRELKLLNIDVFFEEQNIHTLSSDGEFMLSILASYAQEESLSVSENIKWRIRKKFEDGIPWNGRTLGYKMNNDQLVVIPHEALIVKEIFKLYLEGVGMPSIAKKLNESGYKTRTFNYFTKGSIGCILKNYTYTGNLILQKTYTDNHLNKKTLKNRGEKPMYYVESTHEAIISLEVFNRVQELIKQKDNDMKKIKYSPSPLKGKMICGICGKPYKRAKRRNNFIWTCHTLNTLGKDYCPSHQVQEEALLSSTASILGVNHLDEDNVQLIDKIEVFNGNILLYHFNDGTKKKIIWKTKTKSESWTPEMKEKARNRALEVHYGKR